VLAFIRFLFLKKEEEEEVIVSRWQIMGKPVAMALKAKRM
jgi:5,10-methylene-tetrahydrofolate dehydrogenase/methenyl tetrahydrofolate cyclohydrolase